MKQKDRSYNLLCPISRALDHIGDRWALLILRDLHAGPARFKDLQTGLTGIASNLLSDRLHGLETSGLIKKYEAEFGVSLYSLTKLGERTGPLIFELVRFGGRMPRPSKIQKPGNLRTVAVSLGTACDRAISAEHDFEATLTIDGEEFRMRAKDGNAQLLAGAAENPDVIITMSYEPLMAMADGAMEPSRFFSDHVKLDILTPGKETEFFDLLSRGLRELL